MKTDGQHGLFWLLEIKSSNFSCMLYISQNPTVYENVKYLLTILRYFWNIQYIQQQIWNLKYCNINNKFQRENGQDVAWQRLPYQPHLQVENFWISFHFVEILEIGRICPFDDFAGIPVEGSLLPWIPQLQGFKR